MRRNSTLRQRIANASKASDERIAAARQYINEQIGDRLNFNDSIALARLDVRIESLQEERQHNEAVQVLEDERSRTDQPRTLRVQQCHSPVQDGVGSDVSRTAIEPLQVSIGQ